MSEVTLDFSASASLAGEWHFPFSYANTFGHIGCGYYVLGHSEDRVVSGFVRANTKNCQMNAEMVFARLGAICRCPVRYTGRVHHTQWN